MLSFYISKKLHVFSSCVTVDHFRTLNNLALVSILSHSFAPLSGFNYWLYEDIYYDVEVASSNITSIPSFVKICQLFQKLECGTYTYINAIGWRYKCTYWLKEEVWDIIGRNEGNGNMLQHEVKPMFCAVICWKSPASSDCHARSECRSQGQQALSRYSCSIL